MAAARKNITSHLILCAGDIFKRLPCASVRNVRHCSVLNGHGNLLILWAWPTHMDKRRVYKYPQRTAFHCVFLSTVDPGVF